MHHSPDWSAAPTAAGRLASPLLAASSFPRRSPRLRPEEAGLCARLARIRAPRWALACHRAQRLPRAVSPSLNNRAKQHCPASRPPRSSEARGTERSLTPEAVPAAGFPTACVCCSLWWRLPFRPSLGTSRSSWTSVTEVRLARAASCSASVCGLGETLRMSPPFRLPPRTHELSQDEHLTQVPAGCAAFEGFQAPRARHGAFTPTASSSSHSGDICFAIR